MKQKDINKILSALVRHPIGGLHRLAVFPQKIGELSHPHPSGDPTNPKI